MKQTVDEESGKDKGNDKSPGTKEEYTCQKTITKNYLKPVSYTHLDVYKRQAVDRRFRRDGDSATADFIGCVAFGRQAEFAEKYLRQGTKIAITGRIQTGSYTNREGQKVYTTDVVVEEQEFAESKNAGGSNGGYSAPQHNNPAPSANTSDPVSYTHLKDEAVSGTDVGIF